MRIKGCLIPFFTKIDTILIKGMILIAFSGVAVSPDVVKIVVALEQSVMLQHPVILFTDVGLSLIHI